MALLVSRYFLYEVLERGNSSLDLAKENFSRISPHFLKLGFYYKRISEYIFRFFKEKGLQNNIRPIPVNFKQESNTGKLQVGYCNILKNRDTWVLEKSYNCTLSWFIREIQQYLQIPKCVHNRTQPPYPLSSVSLLSLHTKREKVQK